MRTIHPFPTAIVLRVTGGTALVSEVCLLEVSTRFGPSWSGSLPLEKSRSRDDNGCEYGIQYRDGTRREQGVKCCCLSKRVKSP
jgi:hypothetical protein